MSAAQLNRAADLKEKIEKLENELAALLGADATLKRKRGRPRKSTLLVLEIPRGESRKMSAIVRANTAAAAKAWAKARKAGKNSL